VLAHTVETHAFASSTSRFKAASFGAVISVSGQ
jgi:hypothetical protein